MLHWGWNTATSPLMVKIKTSSPQWSCCCSERRLFATCSWPLWEGKKKKIQAGEKKKDLSRYPWYEDTCFGVTFSCGMTGNSELLKSAVHQAVRAKKEPDSKASLAVCAEQRATTGAGRIKNTCFSFITRGTRGKRCPPKPLWIHTLF